MGFVAGFFQKNRNIISMNYDDGTPFIPDAVIMSVSIDPSIQYPEHTMEDGTSKIDHKIVNPTELVVRVLLPDGSLYRSYYQIIKQAMLNSQPITVNSRTDIHANMLINGLPSNESGTAISNGFVDIPLKQALEVSPDVGVLTSSNVSNSSDSDTVNGGQKTANESTETSVALKLAQGIGIDI